VLPLLRVRQRRLISSALAIIAAFAVQTGCSRSEPTGLRHCEAPVDSVSLTPLGLQGEWVTALAATEWGLFAGTRDSGAFRLDSSAGGWVPLGLNHAIVSSLLFVPGQTKRLLVGLRPRSDEQTDAAVYSTEDRGLTWRPWDGGLATRNGRRAWAYALAVDPGNPDRLYLGQSFPILRSHDGGLTWTYVFGDSTDVGMGIGAIVVSPARDGRVWAAGQTGFFAAAVLRSDNWGDTWRTVYPTSEENAVVALLARPSGRHTLWAGLLGHVMRSDDEGSSWRTVLAAESPIYFTSLLMHGEILYAFSDEQLWRFPQPPGSRLGIFRSCDDGLSWDTLRMSVEITGASTVAPGGSSAILIGTRGSGVWMLQP
jgi:photosystem II stability/assembly factor-like uncharacterized protein